MQAARAALQEEFDQLMAELESSQSSVAGLEAQVKEEEEKRETELAKCASVIRDLQIQLNTAEEMQNAARQEVRM